MHIWLLSDLLADAQLREENMILKLENEVARGTIRRQGIVIRQFKAHYAEITDKVKLCICGDTRWEWWFDGMRAGKDGIVGTKDDDLIPDDLLFEHGAKPSKPWPMPGGKPEA
jgi:hypothetical protein